MIEQLHPDADLLSAFVEGVLPEHARAQCLAHLAECSRCRDLVFLTQETRVVPTTPILVPSPARRRWLRPMPLLAVAAALCVALLGAWLYLRSKTGAPPRELAAEVSPAPSSTPDHPAEITPKPVPPKTTPRARRRIQQEPTPEVPAVPPTTVPETPRPPQTSPSPAQAESVKDTSRSTPQAIIPEPKSPAITVQAEAASATPSSGISGIVTDPSGAVVPTATVQLRQLATNRTSSTQTDQSGEFKFTGLAPGQYELQISRPGFRQTIQRVDLHPQEVAAVKPRLDVGSTTETVEVSAASSTIQTESAEVSNSRRKRAAPVQPRPLPSKLPVETMATDHKIILAVDTGGALFFSGNSGKSWKSVKRQWTGKIVSLAAPPELPEAGTAKFQLTTDSGAGWLSRDGRRWYPAPVPH
jgi:hypothetical protein